MNEVSQEIRLDPPALCSLLSQSFTIHALAVSTCYFNPLGYGRRRDNFKTFRDAALDQGADLWVIEAGVTGQWEVADDARMHVVRVRMRDLLWQKERLLNLLIEKLPPEYDAVAWVDCDVLFDNPTWVEDTREALKRHRVAQLFTHAAWLGPDMRPQPWHSGGYRFRESTAHSFVTRRRLQFGRSHPGFAWAARRAVLREIGGLYDRHILGSGDSMMAAAIAGLADRVLPHTLRQWAGEYYRQWSDKAAAAVQGDVGCVPGTLRHLYHGSLPNRRYRHRISRLMSLGFDPDRHIELDEEGLWRWTGAAPAEVRAYVEEYFHARREDDSDSD